MGRWSQARRHGSAGPPTLLTLLTGLTLTQDNPDEGFLVEWTRVAPEGVIVTLSLQEFDIDTWQEIQTENIQVQEGVAFFAASPDVGSQWRVSASSAGYEPVTSDPITVT